MRSIGSVVLLVTHGEYDHAVSQLTKSVVSSVTGDLEISVSRCGQVAENINFNMYVIK